MQSPGGIASGLILIAVTDGWIGPGLGTFYPFLRQTVRVGRFRMNAAGVDIVLRASPPGRVGGDIGAYHVDFRFLRKRWMLCATGSSGALAHNGETVDPLSVPRPMSDGDIVQIGSVRFRFEENIALPLEARIHSHGFLFLP
ncbi:MAG: hypothetical protein HY898_23520 [Deltaproteobacteria bacterium]|nr:hypothetical protein [Deltaproteobacteria bacterium]